MKLMAPSRTRNSVKSHLECRNSYVISWQIACINFRLQLHTLALILPKWLKRETAALNKSKRVRESTSITNTRPDSQQHRHPFSHPARQKFESSICLETDGRAVGGNFGSAPIHLVLVPVLAMSSSSRGEEGVGASWEKRSISHIKKTCVCLMGDEEHATPPRSTALMMLGLF